MTREAWARHVAFVLRCSGAATLSYMLANAIGLPHPVWAAMSGVIVGQEKLDETRSATIGRLFGTVVGVVVAVTIGSLLEPLHADVVVQMAVAVAVAAIIARRYPMLRVCMWTCPIVFLSTDAATPLAVVGFSTGCGSSAWRHRWGAAARAVGNGHLRHGDGGARKAGGGEA